MTLARGIEALVLLVSAAGVLVYAVLLLRAGPPLHHPAQTARLMAALDANGSGALEAAELDGTDPPGQSWHDEDLDGDGKIEPRELEIAMDEQDPRWLLRMPE